jgi:zinc protease
VSIAPTEGLYRERLPNGVTLLVQRRRTAPAAALVTHVRAGFLDEPDERVGISHVLEHMLFKGTPSLGPGELAQRTKALGGWLNAYTAYDRTVYYTAAPARHLPDLIALQADQVQRSLIDADELHRELGVIIQEANRKLDTPGAVAGETLHQLLFDRHRIRRWRIGTADVLERFTRDDVLSYYRSRYSPARVIVSLVADAEEQTALDLLRAAWGDWSHPAAAIAAGPEEAAPPAVHARRMQGDVALAELVVGWRAPGVLDHDIPALELAAAVLTQGRAARLTRLLREPGLVGAVGAAHYGVTDVGVFTVAAELDPDRLDAVLPAIGGAVRDLAERETTPAEFQRARALLQLRIRRRLERYEARAIALADAEAMGDVTRLDREEQELTAVIPATLREAVARTLIADGVSGILYAPDSSVVPFDADILRAAMAVSHTTVRTVAPRPQVRGVTHLAASGLDVLTARHGNTGQVTLSVYVPRLERENPANAGLALLGMRSMLRATHRRDPAALAFAAESLGGIIAPILGTDVLGLSLTVLAEDVARGAELLAEVLSEPRFDPDTVAVERRVLADDARAALDDMVRFPFQLAFGAAFDDTGYGSPMLGTPESVATLDGARVLDWHQHWLAHARTVVAVGDAEPDALAGTIAEVFARTPGGEGRAGGQTQAMSPGTRVASRVRQQSALALVFPGPARTDPERHVAEVWAAIASGLGGRLFESLRSARSLAYSVMASSWQRRDAGAVTGYIAMAPERLTEARDAMFVELERFRVEAPTAAEVSRASAMLAGEAEMSRQTAAALAGEIADAWLLGEGLEELADPALRYRAISVEMIFDFARRTLDPSKCATGVVEAAR